MKRLAKKKPIAVDATQLLMLNEIKEAVYKLLHDSDYRNQHMYDQIKTQMASFIGEMRADITTRINAIERDAVAAAARKPKKRRAKVTEQE